ncbi:MAG: UDP-N-acetylglucosamine--N-acetylmuramyl-(pentapeptide) pyrophosphoryl-undecaprenol N-acetylglucosamine transferase [Oscillospiraceae bacterium]|nr:UDP-N-acetylglucosamine--N-acetylmuramyl-(pentapeptide) pyrophosphoryl-undecaprenol N-acetylglucosamine transferase [Oscillospiraceae bacterium]
MNVLFVCGGTAGHINPAIAIASEIQSRNPEAKILFVGAGKELENRLVPKAGFHIVNIRMSGLRRSLSPESIMYNFGTLRNLTTAGIKAGNLIKRFKPDAAIGTGGYICYPILKRASQLGIPTVIHGADAIPGLATKMLSATVDKVLVSFPGMEGHYRRPDRVIFTGTPIRKGFEIPMDDSETKIGKKPRVVSFWGSLGAARMNEAIAQCIKLNLEKDKFEHIHATGKSEFAMMQERLRRLGVPEVLPDGVEIRAYISDMAKVMASADLVVCRAGASTIAELTAMGKPALLVPSPYVTNNHQEANAKQLQKAGGAVVLLERDCSGQRMFDLISSTLDDKDKLKRMSLAQRTLAVPRAAEKIADIVFDLIARTNT